MFDKRNLFIRDGIKGSTFWEKSTNKRILLFISTSFIRGIWIGIIHLCWSLRGVLLCLLQRFFCFGCFCLFEFFSLLSAANQRFWPLAISCRYSCLMFWFFQLYHVCYNLFKKTNWNKGLSYMIKNSHILCTFIFVVYRF